MAPTSLTCISVNLLCGPTAAELHNSVNLLCGLTTGVWKSRKPESGIGTGMGTGSGTETGNGNGTGTLMSRATDTRTGTSFTLYYFNSDSIYTKNKKTSLISCSPLNLFILRQQEGKKRASKISKATALRVHRAFCQFLHHLCTTTT